MDWNWLLILQHGHLFGTMPHLPKHRLMDSSAWFVHTSTKLTGLREPILQVTPPLQINWIFWLILSVLSDLAWAYSCEYWILTLSQVGLETVNASTEERIPLDEVETFHSLPDLSKVIWRFEQIQAKGVKEVDIWKTPVPPLWWPIMEKYLKWVTPLLVFVREWPTRTWLWINNYSIYCYHLQNFVVCLSRTL